ncbi:dephospho-CoA kinase [Roseimaritima sediminicola]|uniref:dephospho-CoA kinase n=1 Tax=Roseimaritima sediminicola TaxID=2662066 RepID=UPI001EEF4DE8|nr:dephospho-CoA kinase [Roseimaritima sediminicola]
MGLGAQWFDADRLAHQVLQQTAIQRRLQEHFGPQVLADGQVDRRWLASQVFGADPVSRERLEYLEAIIHPPTRLLLQERLFDAAENHAIAALLDVPLLFESGWDLWCDCVWCLDTPLQRRRQWISQRGWTDEELDRREGRQLSLAEKKRRSTHVIINDSDLTALQEKVRRLWDQLVDGAAAVPASDADRAHCTGPAAPPAPATAPRIQPAPPNR